MKPKDLTGRQVYFRGNVRTFLEPPFTSGKMYTVIGMHNSGCARITADDGFTASIRVGKDKICAFLSGDAYWILKRK